MAITNAQQYKQILQKEREEKAFGGVMGKDGRRAYVGGSYGGGYGQTGGGLGGYQGRGDPSTGGVAGGKGTGPGGQGGGGGGSKGPTTSEEQKKLFKDLQEQDKKVTKEMFDKGQSNYQEQFNDIVTGSRPMSFGQKNKIAYQNRIYNARRNNIINQLSSAGLLTPDLLKELGVKDEDDLTVEQLRDVFQVTDDTKGADYGNRSLNLDELTGIKSIQDYVDDGFYKTGGVFDKNSEIYDPNRIPKPFNEIDVANVPGGMLTKGAATLANFLGEKMAGPLTQEYLDKQFNELGEISSLPFNYDQDTSIKGLMEKYEPNRFKLENSPRETGPDNVDPCKGPNPPAYCFVNNDPTEEDATPDRNLGGLAPRFMGSIFDFTGLANGGRAGMMDGGMMDDTPEGGIMDLESGRQMYFLGKLVKKATRAVKKVAKSPFGKAALGAALFKFGGGFGGGSGKGLSSLLSKGGRFLLGTKGVDEDGGTMGLLGKLGLTGGFGGFKPTLKGGLALGFGVPFALDALGVGKEEDDKMDLDDYYKRNSINIADIRNNPYNFLAPRFAADGGLMRTGYEEGGDAEPVAKKTMPLLDMDGQEMDLRAEGGFVPLGRMERADDVPARLSKNEFVFTADAVRNAGEGDIDKGAEVMYNMMKNLESGGEVSEESQGLDGAREMFKTSQRLEEVL